MNPKIHPASADAPITVQNYPGERPVIQGLFWLSGADYWRICGVNVTGAADSASEHMVKLSGGTGWSFTNAEVWGAHSFRRADGDGRRAAVDAQSACMCTTPTRRTTPTRIT